MATRFSKTGHAFVKAAMRDSEQSMGERCQLIIILEIFCCDSGMIPWLMIWEILSKNNKSLAELIEERKRTFPSSGEINFKVSNVEKCIQVIKKIYVSQANSFNEMDGLSASFDLWRFNIRASNTEPLVRLNLETKGDKILLKENRRAYQAHSKIMT